MGLYETMSHLYGSRQHHRGRLPLEPESLDNGEQARIGEDLRHRWLRQSVAGGFGARQSSPTASSATEMANGGLPSAGFETIEIRERGRVVGDQELAAARRVVMSEASEEPKYEWNLA